MFGEKKDTISVSNFKYDGENNYPTEIKTSLKDINYHIIRKLREATVSTKTLELHYDHLTYDNGKESEMSSITTYNNGKITSYKSYDKNGEIENTIYNENGMPLKIVTTEYVTTLKYSKDGNLVEIANDSEKYRFEYKYDSHGNWTKRTTYKNDRATNIEEREIEYY